MIETVRKKRSAGSGLHEASWVHASVEAEDWPPERVLLWAGHKYGDEVAIASAFGIEGIALIDMAAQVWRRLRVFVLDTGFLFPETYRLIEKVEQRYNICVERVLPALTPEAQALGCGPALWGSDPNRCCHLRKVEPLRGRLATLQAWVTSIRRDQTPERAGIHKIDWDEMFHLIKINPLADWSLDRVWRYVRSRDLPYNPLHDRGFPSIGCVYCTRAVAPGESPRAGRWPGFAKSECGLHAPGPGDDSPTAHTKPAVNPTIP